MEAEASSAGGSMAGCGSSTTTGFVGMSEEAGSSSTTGFVGMNEEAGSSLGG